MKNKVIYCVLLLHAATRGSAQVTCSATDDRNLKCSFPENIFSAHKDFSLWFYPDIGDEEVLVDCGWVSSKFHCIRQDGFEVNGSVSDTALITIPTRFLDQKGSYRCLIDGYEASRIPPCRVPEKQVQFPEYSATCEVETFDGRVNLKCRFSFSVDGFNVKTNSSVLAIYTISGCQTSHECHYEREVNQDTFTVKLNVTEESGGEYYCYPDVHLPGLEVKTCVATQNDHSENSLIITLGLTLPLVSAVLVALVLVVRKQMETRKKRVLYHAAPLSPSSTGGPNQRDRAFKFCCSFSLGESNLTNDTLVLHDAPSTGEPNQTVDTFVPRGPPSTGEPNQAGGTFVPRGPPSKG